MKVFLCFLVQGRTNQKIPSSCNETFIYVCLPWQHTYIILLRRNTKSHSSYRLKVWMAHDFGHVWQIVVGNPTMHAGTFSEWFSLCC
mmetsp:Transcript_5349/g.12688  ORF Transcript_5349/g.12688 Transcript_5349/m.12688 type:complete len:87 (-) Transcript_5349:714-974(-)